MEASNYLLTALLAGVIVGMPGMAAPPARIHANSIGDGHTFAFSGAVHPLIAKARDQGEAETSLQLPHISIHFTMTAAQRSDLQKLLAAQQDRSSPQYHKWLTPEQFGERFGLSESDINKVVSWLTSQGFTDVQPSPARNSVTMAGDAALVRYAFQTPIHRYLYKGRMHYANASEPVLPRTLNGLVAGVRGLNNFHPRPRATRLHPRFTSDISGNHYLAPDDFATIYDLHSLYNAGIDGTGQSIAIAGQTDIDLNDIRAFRAASGLQANDPQLVLAGADPGTVKDDEREADMDVEWAGAVARNATIVYVYSTDVFNSLTYAVDNNLAPVIAISYGECEPQTPAGTITVMNNTFAQANAQGITITAASGDTGPADCDGGTDPNNPPTQVTQGFAVDFPASSPNVTGVGGTEFNDAGGTYWNTTNNSSNGSAISYIPEIAWNDSTQDKALSASGGGKSVDFTKPSWQQGAGVPNDGQRDVPDLAIDASADLDGYLVCSAGSCVNGFRKTDTTLTVLAGTSIGPQTFAGIVALLNQKMQARQGNVNQALYSLASISIDAFHDITSGNSDVPCKIGTPDCTTGTLGFSAGTGYDQVTGLGSIDGANLVNEWGQDFQIGVSPSSLTVSSGSSISATVDITRVSNFTGAVTLTCAVPAALTNVTCSVPGTVSGSTQTASISISRSSSGNTCPFVPPFQDISRLWPLAILPVGAIIAALGRKWRMLAGGFAVAELLIMAGCGNGSSPSTPATIRQMLVTQPVTANVTITAVAGTLTRTATLSVTAQ